MLCSMFDFGFWRLIEGDTPGWMPQVVIYSGLGFLLVLSCAPQNMVLLQWSLNIAAVVDVLVAIHFLRRSARQMRKLGPSGPLRARWWIEFAALNWTLCISLGVFVLFHGGAWNHVPLFHDAWRCLYCSFFVLSTSAYAMGLMQRKPIRGKSLELVNWWFWLLTSFNLSYFIFRNALATTLIVFLGGGVAGLSLIAAGVLAFQGKAQSK